MRIYFKISTFDKIIRDEKFNFETKLGAIGGIFGLYNGSCFMSLIEWIYFLFPILVFFTWEKIQQIMRILRNSAALPKYKEKTLPKPRKKDGNAAKEIKEEDAEPKDIQINLPDVDV